MRNKAAHLFLAAAVVTAASAPGRARAGDQQEGTRPPATVTQRCGAKGSFLDLTHGASVDGQGAFAAGAAGYDSARGTGLFETTAEVHLWGPLAIRGGAVYTSDDRRLRPSFGARVQALNEARHGIDGAIGVFYRPEGLTEPEGEIEAVLVAGRHLGQTYLLGNLVYGQDPEGRERDGEVRLAALHPVAPRLLLGFDGRLRLDLGSKSRAGAAAEPTLDAVVGPTATLFVGRVALLLHAGGSALRLSGVTRQGIFVLGGLGTAF
jgi:hypothetical protein